MTESEKVWAFLDDLSHRVARTEQEIKDLRERVYDFIDDLKERIEATNIRQQQVTNDLDDLRDALRTWMKETK